MNVSFDQMTAVAGGINLEFAACDRVEVLCGLCASAAHLECERAASYDWLQKRACTPNFRKDGRKGYWKEVPHG